MDRITQPLTIDFNRTYDKLAIGGYNDQIKIYDVATKKLINTLESRSIQHFKKKFIKINQTYKFLVQKKGLMVIRAEFIALNIIQMNKINY